MKVSGSNFAPNGQGIAYNKIRLLFFHFFHHEGEELLCKCIKYIEQIHELGLKLLICRKLIIIVIEIIGIFPQIHPIHLVKLMEILLKGIINQVHITLG